MMWNPFQSKSVQEVLAASQEGGHHPRFNESTLLTLPVPKKLLSNRKSISEVIIGGVKFYRESEKSIDSMIEKVESAIET